ncbi:MAG: NAD(P)H-dependent glycerol-3-phosphate dehydrogenase [Bacteroidota bacterium]
MATSKIVTVIGGGSFGTTIAYLLAANHDKVKIWLRDEKVVEAINARHENIKYTPGTILPSVIEATSNLEEAMAGSSLIFVSIPSKSFRSVATEIGKYVKGDQILVTTTKGFEQESFKSMSTVLAEETSCLKIGALSGPNFASEILEGKPVGSVIASRFNEVIEKVQEALGGRTIRIYGNEDVCGVELAGALKNIYAICAGIIHAGGFGENAKSLMLSRALSEMSRFAFHFKANPSTFLGLAGVGDLIATCNSELSRNFRIGKMLFEGMSLEDAMAKIGQVVEGVYTLKNVKEKADMLGIDMPIVDATYKVVYEKKTVEMVWEDLMSIPHRKDIEFKFTSTD